MAKSLSEDQWLGNQRVESWLLGQDDLTKQQVLELYTPEWYKESNEMFYTPLAVGRRGMDLLGIHENTAGELWEPCAGIGHLVFHTLGCSSLLVYANELDAHSYTIGSRLFSGPTCCWKNRDAFSYTRSRFCDYVAVNPPLQGETIEKFFELGMRALRPGGRMLMVLPDLPRLSGLFQQAQYVERAYGRFKETAICVCLALFQI